MISFWIFTIPQKAKLLIVESQLSQKKQGLFLFGYKLSSKKQVVFISDFNYPPIKETCFSTINHLFLFTRPFFVKQLVVSTISALWQPAWIRIFSRYRKKYIFSVKLLANLNVRVKLHFLDFFAMIFFPFANITSFLGVVGEVLLLVCR